MPPSPTTSRRIPNCRPTTPTAISLTIAAPEKSARSPNGIAEFRSERWVELYSKKIDEMIAVLKSKGVPVLWVGLPAVRGPKATSDMLFLDSLYRDAADKAGITYVDIWDGFVDEAGRFLQQGPDFEGQIRRLRSYDGVYFTKAGARKLAHYVEREITRVLAARSGADRAADRTRHARHQRKPGQPAPRPLAGPIMPLVASSVGTDQLLGGPGNASGRGRCAGRANAGEGRTVVGAGRARRRFCLAAPRSRPRTGKGRHSGCDGGTGRDRSRRRPKPKKPRPARPASSKPGRVFFSVRVLHRSRPRGLAPNNARRSVTGRLRFFRTSLGVEAQL